MSSLITIDGQPVRIGGSALRVARLEADGYHFLTDPQPTIDGLRECKHRVDLFTFVQPVDQPSRKFDYPAEWDNFAVLPVTSFDHWWTSQVNNKTRNMVRQAERKGVRVAETPFDDELARGIWAIYNESPVRQGRRFAHYGKDVATVYEEEATFLDHSIFLSAFLGDTLIGFIKLVVSQTGSQAGIMNIVSMISHREKAATNALVAQAVRSCAERRIQHLVYAHYVYGNRTVSGISKFKDHNGFQRIDVPRYYVPISAIGHLALSLGFHKKMANRVPESVLAPLRKVRERWYEFKAGSVAVKG